MRIFHPDLHEHDPEKRKTYELLTWAINEARDEEKGRHRATGTHRQGPTGVHPETSLGQRLSLDVSRGLVELRSLYGHLSARVLEIEELVGGSPF